MKNVFYVMSGLKEWVDVAEKLYESEDWKPVYWVTQIAKNHEQVLERFPGVVAHPSQHANRCISAEGFEECFSYPLDQNILLNLKFHESVALEMMDRMDLHDSFRYLDRVRIYNRLIMYWFRIIEKLKPDFIYLDGPELTPEREVAIDLLKLEKDFAENCFVLVDGRTKNVNFLEGHFKGKFKVTTNDFLHYSMFEFGQLAT